MDYNRTWLIVEYDEVSFVQLDIIVYDNIKLNRTE